MFQNGYPGVPAPRTAAFAIRGVRIRQQGLGSSRFLHYLDRADACRIVIRETESSKVRGIDKAAGYYRDPRLWLEQEAVLKAQGRTAMIRIRRFSRRRR